MKRLIYLCLTLCHCFFPQLLRADERLGFTYVYDLLDSDQKIIGSSRKTYREIMEGDKKEYEHSNELQLKFKYFGLSIEVEESDKLRHDGSQMTRLEVDGHYKLPFLSKRRIRWQGERKEPDFIITRTDGDDQPKVVSFPLKDFVSFARYLFDLPPPLLKTAKKQQQKMPLIDLHEMKIIQTPYWQVESKEVTWDKKQHTAAGYGFVGKRGQLEVYALEDSVIWETVSDKVSSRLRERIQIPKN